MLTFIPSNQDGFSRGRRAAKPKSNLSSFCKTVDECRASPRSNKVDFLGCKVRLRTHQGVKIQPAAARWELLVNKVCAKWCCWWSLQTTRTRKPRTCCFGLKRLILPDSEIYSVPFSCLTVKLNKTINSYGFTGRKSRQRKYSIVKYGIIVFCLKETLFLV